MEGKITLTDERGGIIFSANIWTVLLLSIFSGRLRVDPMKARVYVDEFEISKPEAFKEDEEEGGD